MTRRVVGWVGELLVTLGVLLLLFAAWELWWTDVVSNRQATQIVQGLEKDFADGSTPGATSGDAVPRGAFALIRVPRFGADWVRPVIEGTGLPVLEEGVGHYDGTAAPGAVGNFAIAGHRTTYGRPFHDIDVLRGGDRIVVETASTVYVYRVTTHEIVRPWQTEVIAPVPDRPGVAPTARAITLTSCHPRFRATHRYVVHGLLEKAVPRAQWVPAQWLTTPPSEG